MNVNKAMVVGRVTRTPEVKALQSGTEVTSFSLATNHIYYKNEQKVEEVEFHNIVAFGKTAEIIGKYVVKGSMLYVEGRLKTNTWDDKETGKKMYRTEIIADRIQLGPKPKNASPESNYQSAEPDDENEEIRPEDIPF